MTGSLAYVLLAPIFGQLVDRFSLPNSYIIMGIYFSSFGALALITFFRLFPSEQKKQ